MRRDDPLRAGVVGAGYWGANLVRNCAEMGILAAVCDPSPAIRGTVRERYPDVTVSGDLDGMLRATDLEAVVIAAPAPLHASLALRAVDAGKHVFVEKPLALDIADAERVVVAAERAGVRLFVGHVLLYHPAVSAMLELVAGGRIGEVRHLRSRRLSWGRLRGQENVWWSFAPHDCALMLAIMHDEPVSGSGSQSAFVRPQVGDFAYADFAFADGRSAHIEVSWLDPDKSSRIDVFGSRGTLTFIDSRTGPTLTLTPCGDRRDARGEPELWRGEPVAIGLPECEPLRMELDAFCRAVRFDERVPTDGHEGLAVVRALTMIAEQTTHHRRPLEVLA